ncbi:MAG: hypothetical protein ABIJ52_02580 [Pseudomonadota bacterium]
MTSATISRKIFSIDKKIQEKINYSIFDFSYFLTISICEEFLPIELQLKTDPPLLPRYQYTSIKKTLSRLLAKTNSTIHLESINEHMKAALNEIEFILEATKRIHGTPLSEKSRLLLYWVPLLDKYKDCYTKKRFDWKTFAALKVLFYEYLKNCTYADLLKPVANKDKKKNSARILYKGLDNIWKFNANEVRHIYNKRQRYFYDPEKYKFHIIPPGSSFELKLYPISSVHFNIDSIEVHEVQENSILIKKIEYQKSSVTKLSESTIEKKSKIHPSVIFPDGQEFIVKKYTPPTHPSRRNELKIFKDFYNSYTHL